MSRKIVLPDGYYRDTSVSYRESLIIEIRAHDPDQVIVRAHWDDGAETNWFDYRLELDARRYRAIPKEEALVFLAKARLTR